MRKFIFSIFLILLMPSFIFAQSKKDLVVKLEYDTKNLSALDVNSRSFVNAAYSEFLRDILLVPGLSVRTDQVDSRLREIQKQSQIDAGSGMAGDNAAYATDKGSKASIDLALRMNIKGDKYQFVCDVSEIERMNLIGSVSTEFLKLNELSDEKTDRFAYDVLLCLKQRGYISDIPADVVSQLLHQEDSSAAYKRYVQDYTKQIADAEKELSELKAKKVSEQEKFEAENRQRALLLKIEMLEKTRDQMNAMLEKKQKQDEAERKRQEELKNTTSLKQNEFSEMIQRLEAKQKEIRAEGINQLSLKSRIELIESDRANLAYLQGQLDKYVAQSNSFFDTRCAEAVSVEENKAWRNGETDANGVPTATAKKVRQKQIDSIRKKYEQEKQKAANQLTSEVLEDLNSYEKQINDNIAEMNKTTYVFRSIDVEDSFLQLTVDKYDANTGSWGANSTFSLKGLSKVDASRIKLPGTKITYRMMTGKNPASGEDLDAYAAYLDEVDMADLYFRTSVPYLYSEVAIKVRYNSTRDMYEASPISYKIYKTEDRSLIFAGSEKELSSSDISSKNYTGSTSSSSEKQKFYNPSSNVTSGSTGSSSGKYNRQVYNKKALSRSEQMGRNGLFFDVGYVHGSFWDGLEFSCQMNYGSEYLFCGFEGSFMTLGGDSSFEYVPFNLGGLVGSVTTFGNTRLYAELGAGVCALKNSSSVQSDVGGLSVSGIIGCDYVIDGLSLGFAAKLRYLTGMGFVDGYSLSLGISF